MLTHSFWATPSQMTQSGAVIKGLEGIPEKTLFIVVILLYLHIHNMLHTFPFSLYFSPLCFSDHFSSIQPPIPFSQPKYIFRYIFLYNFLPNHSVYMIQPLPCTSFCLLHHIHSNNIHSWSSLFLFLFTTHTS